VKKAVYIFASLAGTILSISAIGKFSNLPMFAVILVNLFSLPVALSSVASILISALEVSIGLTLILYPSSRFSSTLGFVIYLCFALTQAYILGSRGDGGGECGCFGTFQGALLYRISASHWSMLALDTFFAGALYLGTRQVIINPAPSK